MTLQDIVKEKRLEIVKAVCKEIIKSTPGFFTRDNLGLDIAAKTINILGRWEQQYPKRSEKLNKMLWAIGSNFENKNDWLREDVENMLYDKCKAINVFSYENMKETKITIYSKDSWIYIDKFAKDGVLYLPDSLTEFDLARLPSGTEISKIVGGKSLEKISIYDGNNTTLDLSLSPDAIWLDIGMCPPSASLIIPCKNQKDRYYIQLRDKCRIKFSEQPKLIDGNYIEYTANSFLTFDRNFSFHMYSPGDLKDALLESNIKDIYVEGSKEFLVELMHATASNGWLRDFEELIPEIEAKFNVHYNQTRYK